MNATNVISTQLPNMGTDYVLRLVCDFRAITVFLFHDGAVKGAISSRIFNEERFVEIVFLAVDGRLQNGGKGRLLLNYLKTVMQSTELFDFLTCADNNAVLFFRKQGFTDRVIPMDPRRWMGRIKDYEKVTLMYCQVHPEIDYFTFAQSLEKQMDFLQLQIGKRYFNGLFQKESLWIPDQYCPQFLNRPLPKFLAMFASEEMPVEEFSDYAERMSANKQRFWRILQQLQADPMFTEIFEHPVTEAIAPGYFERVQRPMDFSTISKRLRRFNDYYKRPEIFAADIDLIVENCKRYNPRETLIRKAAISLKQKFRELYTQEFPEIVVD
jgi:histone acetyltransferase